MSFLSPLTALVAAAITIPLLVSLYFLKLRRKPLVVPSTLLWKRAVQDLQVNAPFQRIRNSLLLWLQLLLLVLLLLAMARPTQQAEVSAGSRMILVIDHSASMAAEDGPGGQTRLEQAKEEAYKLIDGLSASGDSEGGAMVISFAGQAAVRQGFTTDRGMLKAAVRGIAQTDQRSRIDPVWGLIQPHVTGDDAAGVSVRVLSDLKLHRDLNAPPDMGDADVAAIVVGSAEVENVGIVACSAKRDFESPEDVSIFARLSHTMPQSLRANVTLRIEGQVFRTDAVTLPAANADAPGEASVTFEVVEPGGAAIEVTHDIPDDLAADDSARLQLLPAERVRVLLVTDGNRYLDQAIRATGVRGFELIDGATYDGMSDEAIREGDDGQGGFDIVVFDSHTPPRVPPVSSLSFGAVPPIEGLGLRAASDEAQEMQAILTWKRQHPLMRYVQLDDVALRRPGRLIVPTAGGTVLAVGQSGPLIAVVERDGLRHAVTSFDVMESRWPVHWSFQVFMVNAMEVLGLTAQGAGVGEAALAYQTGQSASVAAVPGLERVGYDGPERVSGMVRRGRAELPVFTRVGWYESDAQQVEPTFERLAVNLLDPVESDLRPGAAFQVGGGTASTVAAGETRREVWYWFAWAALAMLMIEWWVYTGRMRV